MKDETKYKEPDQICELCGTNTNVLKNYKVSELALTNTNIDCVKRNDAMASKLETAHNEVHALNEKYQKLKEAFDKAIVLLSETQPIAAESLKLRAAL